MNARDLHFVDVSDVTEARSQRTMTVLSSRLEKNRSFTTETVAIFSVGLHV